MSPVIRREAQQMMGERAPSQEPGLSMGRRGFLGRSAAAGIAVWAAPTVLSTSAVAAAAGSCSAASVCEFVSGLDGWTIDNNWGSGTTGLWNHNTEASRDGGSLHYGRGVGRNFKTANSRNSGAVLSPQYQIPASGANTAKFTVWRQVETHDAGYDRFRLLIIGATTQTLYSVASIGNTSGFESYTITIPASFNGQIVRFQFDFDTIDGQYNTYEGIYVGRFEVTACPPPGALAGPAARGDGTAPDAPATAAGDDYVPPPRRG